MSAAVCDEASVPGARNSNAKCKEMVCNNCLQLQLGKRRRKPTYKMMQLLDEVGLVPSKSSARDTRDVPREQLPATGRNSAVDMDVHSQGHGGEAEKKEGSFFRQDNLAEQDDAASNGLIVIDDLSKKGKLTAKQQAFRRQKIVLPGQLSCAPSAGPRCYVCWKEYNPAFIYIGCGHCYGM